VYGEFLKNPDSNLRYSGRLGGGVAKTESRMARPFFWFLLVSGARNRVRYDPTTFCNPGATARGR
jgi:hypothetical protein